MSEWMPVPDANNGHVLAFDNVSGLSAWISDTICRLATGGGFAVRQLYTDQDEVLFDAARPLILNGIEDTVNRPDLADRALFMTLEPIPEDRRRPETELWAAFEAEKPRILGALLNAVVQGLKRLPETKLSKLPRMADFALWATACETAIWSAGTFMAAFAENRDEAVDNVIEDDPVAAAVRALIAERMEWKGTASDLLDTLAEYDGGQSREVAEANAYECCIIEWLRQRPCRSDPRKCVQCGEPCRHGNIILPFGTESSGHTWLHSDCWQLWYKRRRSKAITALLAVEIRSPKPLRWPDERNGG